MPGRRLPITKGTMVTTNLVWAVAGGAMPGTAPAYFSCVSNARGRLTGPSRSDEKYVFGPVGGAVLVTAIVREPFQSFFFTGV